MKTDNEHYLQLLTTMEQVLEIPRDVWLYNRVGDNAYYRYMIMRTLSLAGYSTGKIGSLMGWTRQCVSEGLIKMQEVIAGRYPWYLPLRQKYIDFQNSISHLSWVVKDTALLENQGYVNIIHTASGIPPKCDGVYATYETAYGSRPEGTIATIKIMW